MAANTTTTSSVVPGGPSRISTTSSSGAQSFGPYLREYCLMIEYKQLPKYVPTGVYVIPSLTNSLNWDGVIFVRSGAYRGGIFKFVLSVPEAYPDARPSLRFTTNVFHPQVAADGTFDLSQSFPNWRPHQDLLWHILAALKRAFVHVSTVGAVNSEAASLFENDKAAFALRAEQCADTSATRVYINSSDTTIKFSEWQHHHAELLSVIKKESGGGAQTSGGASGSGGGGSGSGGGGSEGESRNAALLSWLTGEGNGPPPS